MKYVIKVPSVVCSCHFIFMFELKYNLSLHMRKPTICIYENKDADQLCSNCTADQRLCFSQIYGLYNSSSTYIQSFKLLALFCECTARFVSDLVGTQIVGFLTHRLNFHPSCCMDILFKHHLHVLNMYHTCGSSDIFQRKEYRSSLQHFKVLYYDRNPIYLENIIESKLSSR